MNIASMRPGLKAREGEVTMIHTFNRGGASMRPGLKAREGAAPVRLFRTESGALQ